MLSTRATVSVQASHLSKSYGTHKVVNDVSFDVAEGSIVAIIGPNGAGKSTTIEMLLGLRKPDSGTVRYWKDKPKREIGVQLQNTPFFPGLTVSENLTLFAAFYQTKLTKCQVTNFLMQCGLGEVANYEASKLSGGQQKRLAIAIALVHQPKMIFLDEPTSALDPRAQHVIRRLIRQLADGGVTIVVTSHDMSEVASIADRVIVFDKGKVRADGTAQELLEMHAAKDLTELFLKLTTDLSKGV
jgi:ABC-2 type transport system ATP-binding protein